MNEKIDLSKYEGHAKKLRLDEGSRDITMINDAGQEFTVKGGHLRIVIPPDRPVGPWNEWKGGLLFDLGEKAFMGNTCIPTARLMADAPLLLEEVKRLQRYEREHKELWDIIANFSPKDSEEDDEIYQKWLESVSQGYMGSVYEYIMMEQEMMRNE